MIVIRPAVFKVSEILSEVGILSPHKDWKSLVVFFLKITFQRDGSQVLEKDTCCKRYIFIIVSPFQ